MVSRTGESQRVSIGSEDLESRLFELKDGRILGYAEFGDQNSLPVLYFPGGNNSRLEAKSYRKAAIKLGVRIISIDRPGFGNSTYFAGRQFLDWPEDVAQLVDYLKIDRFPVFALSGGAPHLLALAYLDKRRISRGAIVSGAAPYGVEGTFEGMWPPIRIMYSVARKLPLSVNRVLQKAMNNPENNMRYKNRMRAPDAKILNERPALEEEFIASVLEAHKNGFEGAAREWHLYTRPWEFPIEDIETEIHLWYGAEDGQAPPAMGRFLDSKLPNSLLKILPDEAHMSLINNHIEHILSELIS